MLLALSRDLAHHFVRDSFRGRGDRPTRILLSTQLANT